MTTRSRLTGVGAFVLLASLVAGIAAAQPLDKRTTFTFNGPVAVPGVTLPAGSYLFHLTDLNYRHVVQVLSADGKVPYAQFFALETWRNTTPSDPEVRFMETAADMPRAIRSFWTPGDPLGYEFMYPREQARLLAEGTGRPVLTAVVPATSTEPARPEYVEPAAAPIAPPYEEEVAVGEPAVVAQAPVELPRTDSPTGTLLLAGLGALLIGVFVHTVRTTLG